MDDLKPGDLLILTKAFEDYFREKNPSSKIFLVNRLAKLEEILDWKSEKGQRIKAARIASGKWKNLPIEENKYIISIFYHDLIGRKGEKGVVERAVSMFRNHPKNGKAFFDKIPEWIYKEIMKRCESFNVELKDE